MKLYKDLKIKKINARDRRYIVCDGENQISRKLRKKEAEELFESLSKIEKFR